MSCNAQLPSSSLMLSFGNLPILKEESYYIFLSLVGRIIFWEWV